MAVVKTKIIHTHKGRKPHHSSRRAVILVRPRTFLSSVHRAKIELPYYARTNKCIVCRRAIYPQFELCYRHHLEAGGRP